MKNDEFFCLHSIHWAGQETLQPWDFKKNTDSNACHQSTHRSHIPKESIHYAAV